LFANVPQSCTSGKLALFNRGQPRLSRSANAGTGGAISLGGNVGICRKPALPLAEAELAELTSALSALGRPLASAAQ
jgi:hypothetical protein